ncbi:adenylate/guanylate cyclase domain-containing protein [Mesorhizobium sp.]|uniref:adenylate/guanylate cyclase domain-containing protein n=1 Tax=Mesorhizobium sp. TaxID=1871066 RepID=UPI0012027C85|nr:adenylate/guanylate cyclase domain-containing protein [Mesorhizobium sp.]TIO08399.1 MAG: adenylate/guanylate cyclase domain-containing protein [Mesorhizobium sp.]TIO29039.1 MAG: adenylate/guanylate cyclase domain-containing protein [Mesorhizobium sp.]
MEQRLAAILAADMAGYSRLMEADESGTLARLRTHRIELVDPAIAKNKGRIIKTTGDGMLVEFQSVTDAVKCAVEIQQRMKRRNSDVPQERRIEFRIGINLGDIIFDDEDIFGDGVNIASRIEQLADVGGICVTAAVATQIADRLEIAMEDLGEKTLKNISRPVRLYRIGFDSPVLPEVEAKRSISKPSIVVLPFNNMSGDPEQEFFADGLTEDIITELSRHHELFVISRNSSFVYKNRAVNVREVAEKLDVQYLVEGSVRKIGDRVRVTVQLIDTANDAHLWADKYDRKLDDIFAIQDEVTAAIAATLPGRVEAAQRDQLARAKPANMAAYECVLAAKVLHHRSTIADNERAQTLIDRAVALDPDYAHAHAWRACILGQAWVHNWCEDRDAVWNNIMAALDRALALDNNDADVHRILAAVNVNNNELTTARYHQERALALNPNYDLVVVQQGELLTWLGRPEEGIEWIRKAMQLNPHHPERFWSHLGKAHFAARQYGEAIEAFMHLSTMDSIQHAFAAACYGWLGDEIAAAAHLGKIRTLDPQFDLDSFIATLHYAQESDAQHIREGLLKAGIASTSASETPDISGSEKRP